MLTTREKIMNLAEIRAYIESHLGEAEETLKSKFAEVVAYVEGKQAKDAATTAAEIADLTAKGYTVMAPAQVTDTPAGA